MIGCTVIISATGDRCGNPAVDVREGIFGGTIAECSDHYVAPATIKADSLIGSKVEISWYTWPKQGVVVADRGNWLDVRFAPRVGAEPIIRSFARSDTRLAYSVVTATGASH